MLAKCEFLNPGFSMKDRIVRNILDKVAHRIHTTQFNKIQHNNTIQYNIIQNYNSASQAESSGQLRPGGTVVAASSGNTGAAVAMLAAMRGYKVGARYGWGSF